MELTKFTHSCVRLDDGARSLVIDPGAFSEVEDALDGASAVLVTHEHADHIDVDKLRAAAQRDPSLGIWGPAPVREALVDLDEQVVVVGPGESFEAGGFTVRTFGGQHALIHPLIPIVPNVGYLIDGALYHPGDSFVVPDASVQTLLLPTIAPWSKASEMIDFAVSVRAPRAFQIHDVIATPAFANVVEGHLQRIAGPFGVAFTHLEPKQTVTI
jgi:L-ascorbate metabolism protein UlaG (beta-lactamase superfamily)